MMVGLPQWWMVYPHAGGFAPKGFTPSKGVYPNDGGYTQMIGGIPQPVGGYTQPIGGYTP